MAQMIKQANIFGRVGSGIGKGLAEQIPKEIERGRLAAGLQQFSQQAQNLSPMQQLAHLSAIPGITPQMIQSFGELARMQARGQALSKSQGTQPQATVAATAFPLPQAKAEVQPAAKVPSPSLTEPALLEDVLEGNIPPTQDEIIQEAGRMFNENPALYNNDPQLAIAAAENKADREQARFAAKQTQYENLDARQKSLVNRLTAHSKGLGVEVPANIYSKIEDKAINAVKPKKQGGEGLTEQQAMKKYGEELDRISRDFNDIKSLGGLITRDQKDLFSTLRALQKNAKAGGYQRDAADTLIADTGASPQFSYAVMYPVSDIKSLNDEIKNLPDIQPRAEKVVGLPGLGGVGIGRPKNANAPQLTRDIAPRLAKAMGTEGSPLSIAYELEKRGYDPRVWKEYLVENQEALNLTSNQMKEIQKPRPSFFGKLNDLWLKSFSGAK